MSGKKAFGTPSLSSPRNSDVGDADALQLRGVGLPGGDSSGVPTLLIFSRDWLRAFRCVVVDLTRFAHTLCVSMQRFR